MIEIDGLELLVDNLYIAANQSYMPIPELDN